MKILIVGLVENSQMDRLRQEGNKRGHNIVGCYTGELTIRCENGVFDPSLRGKKITDFDLIYLWAVGRRKWEWFTVSRYLARNFGTIIVNKIVVDSSFRYNPSVTRDYLLQAEGSIPFPKSVIILSSKSVGSVVSKFEFPLIVKSGESKQGKRVYKVNSLEELREIVSELEKQNVPIVLREFIPNDGDIRVFTVGYKAIGAMKRIPAGGEFRSNISVGGRGEQFDLKKYSEIKELAEKASKVLGVEIAGVDVMIHQKTGKKYILEVNVGPQFTGLEKYTKINVAAEIVKYFEKSFKRSGR